LTDRPGVLKDLIDERDALMHSERPKGAVNER
jgi:hypothetical protein